MAQWVRLGKHKLVAIFLTVALVALCGRLTFAAVSNHSDTTNHASGTAKVEDNVENKQEPLSNDEEQNGIQPDAGKTSQTISNTPTIQRTQPADTSTLSSEATSNATPQSQPTEPEQSSQPIIWGGYGPASCKDPSRQVPNCNPPQNYAPTVSVDSN